MIVIGLILALFVGITLGLVGSGGSILTVPILVYLFHVEPSLATTYSLFAIGVTSMIGSVRGIVYHEIDFQKVIRFGLPSLLMVYITRMYILPLVPELIHIGPWVIHQNLLLMVLFGSIMILSAFSLIKGYTALSTDLTNFSGYLTVLQGIAVGLVTGVVGAGGGFLIIPALINFYKLPMRRAVATSLLIIGVNSLFGLIGDAEKFADFDWYIICNYTIFLVIGIFGGFYICKYINGDRLKRFLGYLILAMGTFIIVKELLIN